MKCEKCGSDKLTISFDQGFGFSCIECGHIQKEQNLIQETTIHDQSLKEIDLPEENNKSGQVEVYEVNFGLMPPMFIEEIVRDLTRVASKRNNPFLINGLSPELTQFIDEKLQETGPAKVIQALLSDNLTAQLNHSLMMCFITAINHKMEILSTLLTSEMDDETFQNSILFFQHYENFSDGIEKLLKQVSDGCQKGNTIKFKYKRDKNPEEGE